MRKGVTPVVAVVLLIGLTVSATGTLYILVQDTQQSARDGIEDSLAISSDNLEVESCWNGNVRTNVAVRNAGDESFNASKIDLIVNSIPADDDRFSRSNIIVDPQDTFTISFEPKVGENANIQLFTGNTRVNAACMNLPANPDIWWNTDWSYRKPVTVEEQSGNNLNNYQVKMNIDTADLISSGKMNSDCSDMRFAASGRRTNHWVENGCNTPSTEVWVKVPSVPSNGESEVNMYYGNSGASSVSSAESTMYIYDLHGDGYDGTLGGVASYNSGNNYIQLTDTTDGQNGHIEYSEGTPSPGWHANWEYYIGDGTGADAVGIYAWSGSGITPYLEHPDESGVTWMMNDHDDCIGLNYDVGNPQCNDIESWSQNPATSSWESATSYGVLEGDTLTYGHSTLGNSISGTWTNSNMPVGDRFGFGARTGGLNNHHWIRSLTVRKYTEPEPGYSIGSEETA